MVKKGRLGSGVPGEPDEEKKRTQVKVEWLGEE